VLRRLLLNRFIRLRKRSQSNQLLVLNRPRRLSLKRNLLLKIPLQRSLRFKKSLNLAKLKRTLPRRRRNKRKLFKFTSQRLLRLNLILSRKMPSQRKNQSLSLYRRKNKPLLEEIL
jgi:hypothetical protein